MEDPPGVMSERKRDVAVVGIPNLDILDPVPPHHPGPEGTVLGRDHFHRGERAQRGGGDRPAWDTE